jgi:hydrogenase maturation protein HypF
VRAEAGEALTRAAVAVRRGEIVAVKGIGGFHLVADARRRKVVQTLRVRKHRDQKPLAVMARTVEDIREWCLVDEVEERVLSSPEAPIVILEKRRDTNHPVAQNGALAPGNPTLGVMLPYTPLHHLLLDELEFPVVATSGNVSDEPICFDEQEALQRLRGIADLFLVHDRPIVRHVDDSVVTTVEGRELVLRRARGYAPLPVDITGGTEPGAPDCVLAVGAHLKNSVALSVGRSVFVSQHIGDLETVPALDAFDSVVQSLTGLYERAPDLVVHDLHPDYLSTVRAQATGRPTHGVQHHIAHVLACLAENQVSPPALGISWDGTGFGTDGTVWGGEFFSVGEESIRRVAHFRTFPLPGGDAAARDGRRAALGMLFEMRGEAVFEESMLPRSCRFEDAESVTLRSMLIGNVNAPSTSSVGRIFDAVAALSGMRAISEFEAQAAMEFEFAATGTDVSAYPFRVRSDAADEAPLVIDWEPIVEAVLADAGAGVTPALISDRFHATLAATAVEVAERTRLQKVLLTGGCFQNRHLTRKTVAALRAGGYHPYWHQRIPPNDGGISLGQVVAAARFRRTIST